MASEYMVLANPRGRRRRKSSSKRRRPRARVNAHRRRRRNPGMYLINRRRRRRRNPRLGLPKLMSGGKLFGLDLMAAAIVTGGAIGTGALTGVAVNLIPFEPIKSGVGRLGAKAGVAVIVAMLAGKVLGRKTGELIALGAGVSIALDGYRMLREAVPALPELGDYNEVLSDYVTEVPSLSAHTEPLPSSRQRITHLAPWQQ